MSPTSPTPSLDGRAARAELFVVSALLLYLELACIRWFPAHVLYLTFFTNTVLLASFLGISLGCLVANRRLNVLLWTPAVLLVAMGVAQAIGVERNALEGVLRVGNQVTPQLVFFGTEYAAQDPARFVIPIEFIEAFFFLLVALTMAGPGQELGRAFDRVPDRLAAYSLNIVGSLVGILIFAAGSWLQLSPGWWFAPIVAVMAYFVFLSDRARGRTDRWRLLPWVLPCLVGIVAIATSTAGTVVENGVEVGQHLWSPYYRIDYDAVHGRQIAVNLIGHQAMVSRDDGANPSFAYALPHLLQRDSGGKPFGDVLVIGAGSGNDVSRALAWGAEHVDAVEIDPAIQMLGAEHHPDHPYADPRVTVHIDDGRNFLRSSTRKYDLIVFALVDSLVLHSGYSNIRLESFMFTSEAFADVRSHLKPDGTFVMYNYFRQGWIVSRLSQSLRQAFDAAPLVLTLPFQETIEPESSGGFTIFLEGATESIRQAFERTPAYWLPASKAPSPATPNGFTSQLATPPGDGWIRFGLARLSSDTPEQAATDDWPFLYLRRPMVPALSLRGIAIMGGIAFLALLWVARTGPERGRGWRLDGRMFFLGAGFMLVETKAVVHMALLFGSTWMVNTIVFAAVLVMILAANLFAARVRPQTLTPYYLGLFLALAANVLVPLDALLGLGHASQVLASSLLAFSPVLFAGVVFAVSFERSRQPDQDFGANVAGAMFGGLLENASMLLGFQYLTLVIAALYALSAWTGRRAQRAPAISGT